MEKDILYKLLDLGVYEEFPVKEVRERVKSLMELRDQPLNNVLWYIANLPEFGECTMNKIRTIAMSLCNLEKKEVETVKDYVPFKGVEVVEEKIDVAEEKIDVVEVKIDVQKEAVAVEPSVPVEDTGDLPPPGVDNEVQQTIG